MIRVFPRKTNATPDDDKVYFTGPPLMPLDDKDVHVSVTFTWDKPKAESLAEQWKQQGYDVKIGGPAYGDRGDVFVPGRYIKHGYTITSRGCNNRCWFCYVWKREGNLRELSVVDGWDVLDSNLLGCSDKHIIEVFDMLKRQPERPIFTGGLEAKLLQDWHIDLLREVNTERMYFAYDTPDDYEPLVIAAEKLKKARFNKQNLSCYCLIGYPKDTFSEAIKRLNQVKSLGVTPFAMLYRDDRGQRNPDWIHLQAQWANPVKIYGKKKIMDMPLLTKGVDFVKGTGKCAI